MILFTIIHLAYQVFDTLCIQMRVFFGNNTDNDCDFSKVIAFDIVHIFACLFESLFRNLSQSEASTNRVNWGNRIEWKRFEGFPIISGCQHMRYFLFYFPVG